MFQEKFILKRKGNILESSDGMNNSSSSGILTNKSTTERAKTPQGCNSIWGLDGKNGYNRRTSILMTMIIHKGI